MRFAVLNETHDLVENVIVANASQHDELEASLGRTLVDASSLDMQIGDFFNGVAWTRNIDGEQVKLPIGDNSAVAEAIAILEGADTE